MSWVEDPRKVELRQQAITAGVARIEGVESNIADRVIGHDAIIAAVDHLMPYVELPSDELEPPRRRTSREVIREFFR